jgi:putative acetyltransferase
MEIVAAVLADAPALAEQMKAVADEGRWIATQSDRTVEELTERFRGTLAEDHIMLTLRDGQRVVGAIGIHPTGIGGVHTLGMSILREYRGQGWGRRLLEAGLDAARERGVRKVVLEVFPENGRAIALYASSGFEIEGYRRDHYPRLDGSVRSAVLMAKFL